MTRNDVGGRAVHVTPRKSLMRNGALSFVFVSVALFGSLYVLAVPLGTWPSVLAIHLAVSAAFVAAGLRYRSTFVAVTDQTLEYHGFLRLKWTRPIDQIATVSLVHIYLPNSPDTSPQLLARDVAGVRVLRMRGLFWYESDMRKVAEALGRELRDDHDPMTTKEFLHAYPGSAFWFEGRPVVTGIAVTLVLASSFGILLGLMALTGITVGLG